VTLVGTVGPGYTIKLTANGQKLVRLKTGTYKFVLHDRASIHSWSLDGPNGFAKDLTTVPFVGTKTVTLTLKAGKYKYYCPPHESQMFAHFTVVA
jgi:plastocyanin